MKKVHISNNIHFIWFGGPLPHQYLANLKNWCYLARRSGYNVFLWMDLPELDETHSAPARTNIGIHLNYLRSLGVNVFHYRDLLCQCVSGGAYTRDSSLSPFNLSLRHYFRFNLSRVPADQQQRVQQIVTPQAGGINLLQKMLLMELTGEHGNFAVASDIFRMIALYFMGGIYADIGDVFCRPQFPAFANPLIKECPDDYTFSMSIISDGVCNDFLVAPAYNQGCLNFIERMLGFYQHGNSWWNFCNDSSNPQLALLKLTQSEQDGLQVFAAEKRKFYDGLYPALIKIRTMTRGSINSILEQRMSSYDTAELRVAVYKFKTYIINFFSGPTPVFHAMTGRSDVFPDEEFEEIDDSNKNSNVILGVSVPFSNIQRVESPVHTGSQVASWLPKNGAKLTLESQNAAIKTLGKSARFARWRQKVRLGVSDY